MQSFNHSAFHRRRKVLKFFGLLLTLGGIFTILDMAWRVPIPLTGSVAVFTGLLMMIVGSIALYNGYKLPLAEAIEIIHSQGKGITASELVHWMRVDRATAERIIEALLRKGFLRSSQTGAAAEPVFDPTR